MTPPVTPDPTDVEPDTMPGWVDMFKTITRPAGCWFFYAWGSLSLAGSFVLAYLKIDLPPVAAGIVSGIVVTGAAHAYQYTWARSGEKKASAD